METKLTNLAHAIADHPAFQMEDGMEGLEDAEYAPDWEDPGTAGYLLQMVLDTASADDLGPVSVEADEHGCELTVDDEVYDGETIGACCLQAIADLLGVE